MRDSFDERALVQIGLARSKWVQISWDIAAFLFGVLLSAALIFLVVIGYMLAA